MPRAPDLAALTPTPGAMMSGRCRFGSAEGLGGRALGAGAGVNAGPALENDANSPVFASYAPTVMTFRAVAGVLNVRVSSRSTSRKLGNWSDFDGLIQQSKSTSVPAPAVSRNVTVHVPRAIGGAAPPATGFAPASENAISCLLLFGSLSVEVTNTE